MIGKHPAKLDDKNRLFVPSKLRGDLGDAFFVTLGINCGHRCLTVYTKADWEQLERNYNALPISQRGAATSLIFMNAADCTPDKQFRFTLTQPLLSYAGIQRDVVMPRSLPPLSRKTLRLKSCWHPWRRSGYE